MYIDIEVIKTFGDPPDLTGAGKEAQQVSVAVGERPLDHVRDVREESRVDPQPVRRPHLLSGRCPVHRHRVPHRL